MGVLTARSASLFRCPAGGVEEALERLLGSWFTSPMLGLRWVEAVRVRFRRRRTVARLDGERGRWGSAARSVLLAIPVLVIVVPLLSAGDAAFAHVLGGLGRVSASIINSIRIDSPTIGYTVGGTWVGMTLLVIAGSRRRPAIVTSAACAAGDRADPRRASFVREVVGALWIVNVTLLGFLGTQIAAAAGVSARLRNDALSYREIAKDGFFPLLAASAFVITALLVAHLMLGSSRWERQSIVSAQIMVLLNLAIVAVAQCADYFDKWHGRNADAMPAFAPILGSQFAKGRVDRPCVEVMLHCSQAFDVSGLRWNFAKARANTRRFEWCDVGTPWSAGDEEPEMRSRR